MAQVTWLALALGGCLVHEREPEDGGILAPDAWVAPDTGYYVGDAGWCECPAPPPGCTYDGVPCGCSHMTCVTPPIDHCGREVCPAGTYCCNSSCSQCVGPGVDCEAILCSPDCRPQDARSGGRCANGVGFAWDGTACRQVACICVGTECDDIFATEAACEAYFGACETDPMPDCHEDDAMGQGDCDLLLGYAFTSRGCMPIGGCSCVGADCASVTGRSEEACNASHANCPILFL